MGYINDNIRKIRNLKDYTQEDMAEKLGITPAGYQKIENGKVPLTIQRLEQIAIIFEMSIVEIILFNYKDSALSEDTEKIILRIENESLKRENKVLREFNDVLKKQLGLTESSIGDETVDE